MEICCKKNGRIFSGFTMVEIAIVLVVIGIIAAVLTPTIFTGIEREKISQGKTALNDFKEQIIGFAMDGNTQGLHVLPAIGNDILNQRDVWNKQYSFLPSSLPDLTALDICSQKPFSGGLTVTTRNGDAVSSVAFLVASDGPDGVNATNYTITTPDLQRAGDDIVEFVTFYELFRKICTPGQTSSSSGDGSTPNPPGGQITFGPDMLGFTEPVGYTTASATSETITVDTGSGTVDMGNNINDGAGCLWFRGDYPSICTSGNCTFGTGLRAYFDFDFTGEADGFTFAVIGADNNTASSCGGQGVGDDSQGENLGYAGKGLDGRGISPPKMALEFDIYWNDNNANVCSSGSRNDYRTTIFPENGPDHLAFIYWGNNDVECSGSPAFDDNRHGRGDGSNDEPTNSRNTAWSGDGSDGYYYAQRTPRSWLQNNGPWKIRIEIKRNQTVNSDGNYDYTLYSWLKQNAPSNFTDMSVDYNSTLAPPNVIDSIALSSDLHDRLNNIFFGWTEGTGAETQSVTISNFKMSFRQ